MRQDPDCILVGEIRDEETAEAAIHAASTGHLVLSTVHANSAMESIERVSGLGVKRDLIEANLLFASAQRLVPRNCPHCLRDDVEAVPLVTAVFGEPIVPKTADGCEACRHTGVSGRVLFFEHIVRETNSETNQKQLVQHGSLRSCALEALRKGEVNAQNACAFD
jgi:type II secretory ATPase GspE/PulE/Tfp pilus assembly ATPase PilB-like protein